MAERMPSVWKTRMTRFLGNLCNFVLCNMTSSIVLVFKTSKKKRVRGKLFTAVITYLLTGNNLSRGCLTTMKLTIKKKV